MRKKTYVKVIVYFLGFVLPILSMLNCDGLNEGNMAVTSCVIDSDLIRSYASFYWGWLAISSFMLFIPVIIYILVVVFIAKFTSKWTSET